MEELLVPKFNPVILTNMEDMALDCRSVRKCGHVLCCLSIGRGHVTPMVNLAKDLARLGMSITIVFSSPSTYSSVVSDNPAEGLDIAFVELQGIQDVEGRKDGIRTSMEGVRKFNLGGIKPRTEFADEERALEDLIHSMQTPPIAIISDMLVAWATSPAKKMNLKQFVLFPAAPFYLAALLRATSLILEGVDPNSHNGLEIEKNLPVIPWAEVPDYVKNKKHPFFNWLEMGKSGMLESDGILLNTFKELDGKVLKAVEHMLEAKGVGVPIFAVGPLVHPLFLDGQASPERLSDAAVFKGNKNGDMRCLEWLEDKPERSVVFVCFGSWETLKDAQIAAIAEGLEASKHPFIWVTSECSTAALPQGFQGRIQNQGLIVSDWAPQQVILRHSAIGGFVTHCGWNSVMECMSIAGIPMVCWPFLGDQPFVCRYVVDELKIGIEVEATADGFVGAEEVEKCVRIVMEEANGMRERAAALRKAAILSRCYPLSSLLASLKLSSI